MDLSALAEHIGLEEDEFRELIELFVEVSGTDLNRLESGIEQGDSKEVVEAAHSIKGAAINLGLQDISEIAHHVEMNARGDNLDGGASAIERIKERLEILDLAMKEQFRV